MRVNRKILSSSVDFKAARTFEQITANVDK